MRLIPSGVTIPESVAAPDTPPHALYAGRLSEEKGVRELAAAADGIPLVVVGDGPLRSLLPQAVGFVPPRELGSWYERAAVVVVPSRREGYGMVAREAMAYGRPVVATAVGGLIDAVEDGVTGLLVAPGTSRAYAMRSSGSSATPVSGAARRRGPRASGGREPRYDREAVRTVYADAVSPRGSGRASAAPGGRRSR